MYTQLAFRRFWYSVDVELLVWQRVLIHNDCRRPLTRWKSASSCLCKLHSVCVQGLYEPFACIWPAAQHCNALHCTTECGGRIAAPVIPLLQQQFRNTLLDWFRNRLQDSYARPHFTACLCNQSVLHIKHSLKGTLICQPCITAWHCMSHLNLMLPGMLQSTLCLTFSRIANQAAAAQYVLAKAEFSFITKQLGTETLLTVP